MPAIPPSLQKNAEFGAFACEMEASTLFIIGTMRKVKTAYIGTADGNVIAKNYEPHDDLVTQGKTQMIKAGLQVAANEAR